MDHFITVQYYILTKTTLTAADVTDTYINNICRLYSLLRHISSDCGLQFASTFLQVLNQNLSSNLGLSTAYHLQTDRLREWWVSTVKLYLCIYYYNRQKCCRTQLPLLNVPIILQPLLPINSLPTEVIITVIVVLYTLIRTTASPFLS